MRRGEEFMVLLAEYLCPGILAQEASLLPIR
jgi:hypothetical protein